MESYLLVDLCGLSLMMLIVLLAVVYFALLSRSIGF